MRTYARYVSICIPAYQEAALLYRALESVFSQTFSDFEVIVTDDSETSVVQDLIARDFRDPRLKYLRNKERLDSPNNWNKSIDLATGELVKMLHQDDWFSSNYSLQHYVSLIK